jgi:AraC-like DNA-binding protein
MFFVPLPFVVGIILVMLLAQMTWRQGTVVLANRPFRILLGGYALLSVLVGLRWGYQVKLLLPLQASLAAGLAAWSWCCFDALANDGAVRRWRALHALPALAVLLLFAVWRAGVDAVVVVALGGYGIALVRLARRGPDALGLARLDEARAAHRALWTMAALLLLSVVLEVFIVWDLFRTGGRYAGMVVGGFHLAILLLAGWAASMAGDSVPDAGLHTPPPPVPADCTQTEDLPTMAVLNTLMQTQKLYLEPDLNLVRLARKSGIPARQVSAAINRVAGQNVSQYVNGLRIQHACDLLRQTDQSVTEAMLASGFQTKSNFQREFRRVTGSTPVLWRQQAAA